MSQDLDELNPGQLWCRLLIHQFSQLGLTQYYVSPGYRSAPLVAALIEEDSVCLISCVDERAAAFRALGYARATGIPAACVCTSGTAFANYAPAVLEAYRQCLPFLILSADRPSDLNVAGAHQTIDQAPLLKAYTQKVLLLPDPHPNMALGPLLQEVRDCFPLSGPVQINIPLREPLIPSSPNIDLTPYESFFQVRASTEASPQSPGLTIHEKTLLKQGQKRLFIFGDLPAQTARRPLIQLIQKYAHCYFADITSQLKAVCDEEKSLVALDHPETLSFLLDQNFDQIWHFGGRVTAKHFYTVFLKQFKGRYYQFSERSREFDPAQRVNAFFQISYAQLESELSELPFANPEKLHIPHPRPPEGFHFYSVAQKIWQQLQPYDQLFLGNSTCIRVFNDSLLDRVSQLKVQTQRGVSGIEGHLSTCLGLADATTKRVVGVFGDLAMLHDLNALVALQQQQANIWIIVMNNSGGRIFDRLPLKKYPQILSPYINTPHALQFAPLARALGLEGLQVASFDGLKEAFVQMSHSSGVCFLEVLLDPEADLLAHTQFMESLC